VPTGALYGLLLGWECSVRGGAQVYHHPPPSGPSRACWGASESFADRKASQHGRHALAHAQHSHRVPRLAGSIEFGGSLVRGDAFKLGEDFPQGRCAAGSRRRPARTANMTLHALAEAPIAPGLDSAPQTRRASTRRDRSAWECRDR
jgi:hypothetical protein